MNQSNQNEAVRWRVSHDRGTSYFLHNDGEQNATGVSIEGRPAKSKDLAQMREGQSVAAGDLVEFNVFEVGWGPPRPTHVAITWDGHPEPLILELP